MNKIYTHDEAARIVEIFEDILDKYNITLPSDEDEDKEDDNLARLYGSTYSDILDSVEENIINIVRKVNRDTEIIEYKFSGEY